MEIFRNNVCVSLLTIVLTLTAFHRVRSIVVEDANREDTKWKNCSLNFTSMKEYHLFNKSIVKNRLVKLSINLTWLDIPINGTRNNSEIVKKRWFIATEEAGKDLLLLDNLFEIMSLGTLSIKVGSASLTLMQTPYDCIAELSKSQARETISAYVLGLVVKRNMDNEDKENEDETNSIYVCNGTLNENGVCRVLNNENMVSYMELEENKWTRRFHIIVYIMTVIVISQSISLIPKSFYKDCEVRMASVKTPIKFDVTDINLTKLKFSKNENNEQSEPEITKCSQPVLFYLEESRFESQTLKTSGFLNVFRDLLQFINEIFCKCMYKDREEVKECCNYHMCRSCYCHNCLSWLMIFLLLLIILSPVILRILLLHYADVENFRIELTLFICGLLNIAILILYYILILKIGLFKKILDDMHVHVHLKECLRLVMATRLQDELITVLKWISCGFVYCTRRSRPRCWMLLFIIVVIPSTIILYLLKMLVVMHPLLHFILRFPLVCFNLNCQKVSDSIRKLEKSCTAYCHLIIRFILITIFYILFVTLFATLFFFIQIFIRMIVFYITCILYVAIGCLLNFEDLSVYITDFVLISTYMYRCIQNVSTTTRRFKKKIIDAILECGKKNSYPSEIGEIIKHVGDTLYLKTNHFVFYYKSDTFDKQRYMYVSKAFLERVSSIRSDLTPGPRYWLYCKAFVDIGAMFTLLGLFVIIVVSFGKAIDLSTGVKTLITLGSGALLVFLFDKFFVKSVSHSVYDNKELFAKFIKDQLEIGVEEIWKLQLPEKRSKQMDFELAFGDTSRLDSHDLI